MPIEWINLQKKFAFDFKKINKELKKAIAYLDIKKFHINIILVSKKKILQLNKKYRMVNATTDVISFTADDVFIKRNILGDIFICPEVAKKQAHYFNHSLEKEITILAIHGLLHLLGYDHLTDNGEMDTIQNHLVSLIALD